MFTNGKKIYQTARYNTEMFVQTRYKISAGYLYIAVQFLPCNLLKVSFYVWQAIYFNHKESLSTCTCMFDVAVLSRPKYIFADGNNLLGNSLEALHSCEYMACKVIRAWRSKGIRYNVPRSLITFRAWWRFAEAFTPICPKSRHVICYIWLVVDMK